MGILVSRIWKGHQKVFRIRNKPFENDKIILSINSFFRSKKMYGRTMRNCPRFWIAPAIKMSFLRSKRNSFVKLGTLTKIVGFRSLFSQLSSHFSPSEPLRSRRGGHDPRNVVAFNPSAYLRCLKRVNCRKDGVGRGRKPRNCCRLEILGFSWISKMLAVTRIVGSRSRSS